MVNSLTNAVQFGLREAEANGRKFEIVVPLYSELMARGAGGQHQGHPRLPELGLETRERNGREVLGHQRLRAILRHEIRVPAPARRRTPATCRRCSMPTL